MAIRVFTNGKKLYKVEDDNIIVFHKKNQFIERKKSVMEEPINKKYLKAAGFKETKLATEKQIRRIAPELKDTLVPAKKSRKKVTQKEEVKTVEVSKKENVDGTPIMQS